MTLENDVPEARALSARLAPADLARTIAELGHTATPAERDRQRRQVLQPGASITTKTARSGT
jgi:hypothetical protein